ncbi:MAG: YggS family pyridoxal phosphate-dependent enzyme [Gammaproteobacteria bacterium]|nr:MAG: YggS family pyridoxal phosphate-dependent enzyme [Gammaproteobacteria bacterium]
MRPMNTHSFTAFEIAAQLAKVKKDIAAVAQRAGRSENDVRLIAVSKTRPVETVAAALKAGQTDFGENTIQDARPKLEAFSGSPIYWHFIGHLQTNKAKYLAGAFQWLHTLDKLTKAEKLSKACAQQAVSINTLIQVNVSRDPAKHGVAPGDLDAFVEALLEADLAGIKLKGLMTIAKQTRDEIAIRQCFSDLRETRDKLQQQFGLDQFTELSMGMSGDYKEAITEGATMVRIGTTIFGQRT